jgi:hypothetical protein
VTIAAMLGSVSSVQEEDAISVEPFFAYKTCSFVLSRFQDTDVGLWQSGSRLQIRMDDVSFPTAGNTSREREPDCTKILTPASTCAQSSKPPDKMSKKATIPDAWDDDWEAQADKADVAETSKAEEQAKISKAERLARHAETNKKIWESA